MDGGDGEVGREEGGRLARERGRRGGEGKGEGRRRGKRKRGASQTDALE